MPPSDLDAFKAWYDQYTREHGGAPGTVNDERDLATAWASKQWGDRFAREYGRAPTDADWRERYYNDQRRQSDRWQDEYASAAADLARLGALAPPGGSPGAGGPSGSTGGNAGTFIRDLARGSVQDMLGYLGLGHWINGGRSTPGSAHFGGAPPSGVPAPVRDYMEGLAGSVGMATDWLSDLFGRDAGATEIAYRLPFEGEYEFMQGFGANPERYTNGIGNPGPDWKMPIGTPLLAPVSGTVVLAGEDGNWGNHLKIDMGDYTVGLGHMSEISVEPGQQVTVGMPVGASGNTGYWWGDGWDGGHVDLHMYDNATGKLIDPAPYFGFDSATGALAEASTRLPGTASPPRAPGSSVPIRPDVPDVPYGDLIAGAASRYGLDPALVASVVRQESDFNPNAVSGAGARGLTQVMPGTGDWLAELMGLEGYDPFDPATSIDMGSFYLQWLSDYLGTRDPADLVHAYHDGPGNYQRGYMSPAVRDTYIPNVIRYMSEYR